MTELGWFAVGLTAVGFAICAYLVLWAILATPSRTARRDARRRNAR